MDTAAEDAARRVRSARFATMPIVLAGTIAVTAGLTGPVAHAEPRHDDSDHRRHVDQDRTPDRDLGSGPVFTTAVARQGRTVATTVAATRATAPTEYVVRQGDTVSGIAARYGLSAQEVLLRNGLSWNTIIHPGQTLRLATTPHAAVTTTATRPTASSYHVRQGDTVSAIAAKVGVSTAALLQANQLSTTSVIYPGQTLRMPSASPAPAPSSAAPSSGSTAAPTRSGAGSVRIGTGDTIASIAAAHGVSVQALLSANGLSYTSTIYAGKTLVIPATGPTLSAEQRANAARIVAVGRSLGVPHQGLVVALAAAMQESGLRNIDHGDRDSVGLFQQRPSQGWGKRSQLMDPTYAARAFFTGVPGHTNGLLDIPAWSSMSVTDAAQAVQISAFPNAYGQWATPAAAWLSTL